MYRVWSTSIVRWYIIPLYIYPKLFASVGHSVYECPYREVGTVNPSHRPVVSPLIIKGKAKRY